MSPPPLRLRISPALQRLVTGVSPNTSAGLRALLLLGAHAAGYDLSDCRADLGRLLGEEFAPPLRSAVEALYQRSQGPGPGSGPGSESGSGPGPGSGPGSVGQPTYERPTDVLPPPEPPSIAAEPSHDDREADPLAGVGIEV